MCRNDRIFIIAAFLLIVCFRDGYYTQDITRNHRDRGYSMYYSSGNYEAFAHPEKPLGVEHKSAYLIGSGLASLAAACFLVRDGQMPGNHIHILERDSRPGGALDGDQLTNVGYVMRGGREMDNHFECMWDLFRSHGDVQPSRSAYIQFSMMKAQPAIPAMTPAMPPTRVLYLKVRGVSMLNIAMETHQPESLT